MTRLLLLPTLAALGFFACSSPAPKCDVSSCASGCCDVNGACQVGDSAFACGSGGALCSTCASGICSPQRICTLGGTGGGAGGGAGGGTGGGGGSSDGGTRTVVLTITNHLIGETTTQDVSGFDPSRPVGLFLANGSTLTELPGSTSADRYTVPNVPAGPYVVRYGRGYYVDSADSIDLGWQDVGRADVDLMDAGAATLTLAVAGLPAWTALDDVMFYSQGAAFYGNGSAGLVSGPADGEVPTSFTFDYGKLSFGTRAARVEATKGDSLWLTHMKTFTLAEDRQPGAADDGGTQVVPLDCNRAGGTAHLTSLDVATGPNAASATFTETSPTTVGVAWPRTQWAARAPEVHPQAQEYYEGMYFSVAPQPGVTSADVLWCAFYPDTTWPLTNVARSVTLNDPYDAAWARTGFVETWFRVPVSLPDAGVWSSTGSVTALATAGDPLTPAVHSAGGLTVQGVPAADIATASAASPITVTWTASPGSPAATDYEVVVMRITKTNGETSRTAVVFANTPGTSFTFPPGSLEVGGIYFVVVRARVWTAPGGVRRLKHITSTSDALTRPFVAQ